MGRLLALAIALPAITSAANPVEALQRRLASGDAQLEFRAPRGYLDSLLEALEISPLTQTLVFSKTSAQFRLISPRSPRALYFNDDVYVGWVRGGPFLEISTADTERGAAFYTLRQEPVDKPRLVPDRAGQCLQCHESPRTRRVPGHLTRSVHPAADGQPVFRLGTEDVDHRTPLAERFGGWFVTGAPFEHLGNRILPDRDNPEVAQASDLSTIRNLDDYLRPDSDIVAHLLLAHQTQTHNRIARAALEARKAIAYRDEMNTRFGGVSPETDASIKRRIERPAEELLEFLLLHEEAPLPESIALDSPLAREFATRGPLHRLNLEARLLEGPVSYLILSEAFKALPAETREYVIARLAEVSTGQDDSGKFELLSDADRKVLAEVLGQITARP